MKENPLVESLNHAFTQQWFPIDFRLHKMDYYTKKFFPYNGAENHIIYIKNDNDISGINIHTNHSAIHMHDFEEASYYLPLYIYKKDTKEEQEDTENHDFIIINGYRRYDIIRQEVLEYFRFAYLKDNRSQSLNKERIFYYLYGLLHAPDYKKYYWTAQYNKPPIILCVACYDDFMAFERAGMYLSMLQTPSNHDIETIEKKNYIVSLLPSISIFKFKYKIKP